MNIQTLYLEMERDDFLKATLSGELELKGNCVIWSYELYETADGNEGFYNDDEEMSFAFGRTSNEEILLETHRDDSEEIKDFIGELENEVEWDFSEPEIIDNKVSFKIF